MFIGRTCTHLTYRSTGLSVPRSRPTLLLGIGVPHIGVNAYLLPFLPFGGTPTNHAKTSLILTTQGPSTCRRLILRTYRPVSKASGTFRGLICVTYSRKARSLA